MSIPSFSATPILSGKTGASGKTSAFGKSSASSAASTECPKNGHRYRVLSYQRVSKEEAQTGSFTFDTQTLRIREKLDALYGARGYDLVEFKDDGLSGGYGPEPTGIQRRTRPTLKRLVQELKSGTYDCLIVYSFSRLVRSPRWFHQLLEDAILPSGAAFLSATENLDLGSAEGRAMAGMLAVFDGFYRDSVIKRNKDAAATRIHQGYLVGNVGYGWCWEPKAQVAPRARRRIFPDPDQGPWVVQIKDWYLAGWSPLRIAGELNSLGVASASGKSRWTGAVVYQVLSSPVHAGLLRWDKGLLRGEHFERRHYDPSVYEQIQSARVKRTQTYRTNTAKSGSVHLLNGLVFCARCGKRLYISSPNTVYRTYRCTTGMNQGQRTCPDIAVRAETLEDAVAAQIARLAQEPELRALLDAEAHRALADEDEKLLAQREHLREQVQGLNARFERWAASLSRGTITDAQFTAYNETLQSEQAQLGQRLAEVEGTLSSRERREAWREQVRACVLDFERLWQHLNLDERREVFALLLESLDVERDGRDYIARVKVHLLPACAVPILVRSQARMPRKAMTGLQSLSPRHLALLHWVNQNKSLAEAGDLMGIRPVTVKTFVQQIQKRLGTKCLADAGAMAKGRIHSFLPTLPLNGRLQPVRQRGGTEGADGQSNTGASWLSPKLMEVFRLLISGATTPEIARLTGLPKTTIAGRRALILERFGTKSLFEASQKARAEGIL